MNRSRNLMVKLASVGIGLVATVGAFASTAHAAPADPRPLKATSAQAANPAQVTVFFGRITAFKDDYLELATQTGQMRFSLRYGAEYYGPMRVDVYARVEASFANGEWYAKRIYARA
ncbi:hypothetical protein C9F11_01285 [Streptomyces sp. YIM 121038]|uniref:hypothetical protein n=1 Tax=Streptomyces sp. YIM 121038 TaxID=2136401 RepID=UPI001110A6C3|nr:hypothetical protein [Streptomyces sp. YIM 121038]QCX73960.1 hypothetical protein C9F11_01285 [Streptomyces sp. YIM 121038]